MRKNLFNLILLTSLSLLFSCSTSYKTTSTKSLDIYGSGVIHKPVIADLEVKEFKVTGSATSDFQTSGIAQLKQKAIANALKEAGGDLLVEPRFSTESSRGRTTVTVSGWPASYKNFRSIQKDDIELLKAGVVQKAEVHEPAQIIKKKNIGLLIGSITLGVLLLAGISAAASGY